MSYERPRLGYDAIVRHRPQFGDRSILMAVLPEHRPYEPPPGFGWGMQIIIQPKKGSPGTRTLRELRHYCGSPTIIRAARERIVYAADAIWHMTSDEIMEMRRRDASGEFNPVHSGRNLTE